MERLLIDFEKLSMGMSPLLVIEKILDQFVKLFLDLPQITAEIRQLGKMVAKVAEFISTGDPTPLERALEVFVDLTPEELSFIKDSVKIFEIGSLPSVKSTNDG